MKGLAYRLRAARNAGRSRYGVNEDRVGAFIAIVGALDGAGWDRFARGVAQMAEADLVRPWHAVRGRVEAAVDEAARGAWWEAAVEDVMRVGGRGIMDVSARQNHRLLVAAPASGGLAVLGDLEDLARILMAVAGALTVWDVLRDTDRTLIYLPVGAAIPTAALNRSTDRAAETRRSGQRATPDAKGSG